MGQEIILSLPYAKKGGGKRMDTDSEAILKDVENRDKRKIVLKNIAFALLEQCKSENLTIKELESVLETVRYYSAETTLRDGLRLQ
nr:hypothetical protein [uncultured Oscillibacter sp.]